MKVLHHLLKSLRALAMPPIKMGCVEQPHAEKAHKIGEDNEKLFKEFDL